jgi:hypothetical protein
MEKTKKVPHPDNILDGLRLRISEAISRYGFKQDSGGLQLVFNSDIKKKRFVIDVTSLEGVVREVKYVEPQIQIETNYPDPLKNAIDIGEDRQSLVAVFDNRALNQADFDIAKTQAERIAKEVKKIKTPSINIRSRRRKKSD